MACFELRAVTASSLVGGTSTQLIILCPQTDSILLDSNDDEEMAAPVNTGQLIYCSELILAHQKTFTELTSLIMIGMKLKIIKAPIYVKTPFNLCFFFLTGPHRCFFASSQFVCYKTLLSVMIDFLFQFF